LVIQTGVTAGKSTYLDATASMLTSYGSISSTESQRLLKDSTGKLIVSTAVGGAYDKSKNLTAAREGCASAEALLNKHGYASTQALANASTSTPKLTYDAKQVTYYTNTFNGGVDGFLAASGVTTDKNAENYDSSKVAWYTNTYNQIAANGYNAPGDDKLKDSSWLYDQFNNNNLYLEKWNATAGDDAKGAFQSVSWKDGDNELVTKTDDTDLARAEADYGVKTAEIQSQDKKYDLSLQNINTEHTAIQTEVDSVKKVIEKNIDRGFKIFSA